eukprot:TRINITY_DN6640_c0_g1_i1.p1 TRINITY_DN6640_c0_g1~~TRINITY_DN6640_c0_g1_i1.p1  ORF type:complete len:177 (-),score=62.95 TRINITY_DN6640_c0_g1_i1:238-711(-)
MGIKINHLAGKDLFEGNKKVILSFMQIVWRFWVAKKCGNEAEIVKWVNSEAGMERIGGLEDRKIGKGIVIAEVMERKGIKIDWSKMKEGKDWKEKEENAKYVMSVAWSQGLTVWMTWQSIVKVRPGILLAFLSSFDTTTQNSNNHHNHNHNQIQSLK